jgi:hypothetical protein
MAMLIPMSEDRDLSLGAIMLCQTMWLFGFIDTLLTLLNENICTESNEM